jgi:hypothetical protein
VKHHDGLARIERRLNLGQLIEATDEAAAVFSSQAILQLCFQVFASLSGASLSLDGRRDASRRKRRIVTWRS